MRRPDESDALSLAEVSLLLSRKTMLSKRSCVIAANGETHPPKSFATGKSSARRLCPHLSQRPLKSGRTLTTAFCHCHFPTSGIQAFSLLFVSIFALSSKIACSNAKYPISTPNGPPATIAKN